MKKKLRGKKPDEVRITPNCIEILSQPERVEVRVFGEILDEKYSRLLMKRTDLDLWDVILLDKVQKRVVTFPDADS